MTKTLPLPAGPEGMVYYMLRATRTHKFTARELMALLLLPSHRAATKGKTYIPTIGDVAATMDIPKPSASRTVAWLVSEELVINVRDPKDTRRNMLYRSAAGDALVSAMATAAARAVRDDPEPEPEPDDTEGL